MNFRAATPDDVEFLWLMLTYAANVEPSGVSGIPVAKSDGYLRGFVEAWPRPRDRGIVAFDDAGARVGAAWARLRPPGDSRHSVATETEPELLVAVSPDAQRSGVGSQLVSRLLDTLQADGFAGVRLSVRDTNEHARKLYERLGFSVTREIANRERGMSYWMRIELVSPT